MKYFTVYKNLHDQIETCLKELNIEYYTKKQLNWTRWGSHQFSGDKKTQDAIVEYFSKNGIALSFVNHSIFITPTPHTHPV